MSNKDLYLTLAEQYTELLRDSGTRDWRHGVCGELDDRDYWDAYRFMKEQQEEWAYYSGNHTFPIPPFSYQMSELNAYLYLEHNGGLWCGNQLMYRRSLLRFLIRRATEEASRYE